MKETEVTKYQVGGDTMYIREGNVIHVVVVGYQSHEFALKVKEKCSELANQIEGMHHYLIDLNKCGKNDAAARKVWKELSRDVRTNKVATFGMNPVSRVIANFVIGTYEGKNIRFFKHEKDALKWLKEEDKD
ncbi:hypothetical protein [Maribellus sediminis]|uniref:DUF7793 family protein n=1 Tax=Maribellus sediminis TaxID=2696285 RepID=UPI00143221C6|nr:hypothetical protein [Maribellus sediminis]